MRTDPSFLPDVCGVYLFKDREGKVLYVGKAINIRSRVRSHLKDRKNEKEIRLQGDADMVDWIATGNELEALVLEDTLIKRYRPKFNVRLKDDKSYPYILITEDTFPAVHHVRGFQRGSGEYFGPHSDPRAVRRSIRWIRKMFPLRSCRRDLSKPSRPCLEHHLGRCLAPCSGKVDKNDYALVVEGLRLFLSGKREEVLSRLEKDMWKASSREEYERAAMIRDIADGLKRSRQSQKMVLCDDVDLDAVHIDENASLATVVKVRDGSVIDAVSFSLEGEDSLRGATEDFLSSFYAISGSIPPTIVLSRMELVKERKEELQRFLGEKRGARVRLVRARGAERRSLMEMARRNMELFRTRKQKELRNEDVLSEMRRSLGLSRSPVVIEGFDISHLGGTGTVASMVQFREGRPIKSAYRRYKIRTDQNDDYLSMKEAVTRRYRRIMDHDGEMPDLILIDGGKGQLKAAMDAFGELGIEQNVDMVSLAKRDEEIFLTGRPLPVVMKRSDPSLELLMRIRDEAHRFALSYQRTLREREIGIMTRVEGIGKARAKKLLNSFVSIDAMLDAGPREISEKCSINITLCERLVLFLREELHRQDLKAPDR
ncbi:MAG: excinuclease ABC subunit UvrC [Candidatus Thermoplasmatota archaeon]|nr:excinuclease ABC subunit UvrC [Candidatus Thermoplasmatota archaeon]